jgi:hypothetical protein
MAEQDLPDGGPVAAVIGDLVGSRRGEETGRREVHAGLLEALGAVNEAVPAVQPLTPTIGDEFQGIYERLPSALLATLLVRLRLVGTTDVRFGVGWGRVVELEAERTPLAQDGPGWWSAREAIDEVRRRMLGRRTARGQRTLFSARHQREAAPRRDVTRGLVPAPQVEALLNGLLVCRDELVAHMDARDTRILLGLFEGASHGAMAQREGVTQPAVSQRAVKSGAYAVIEAQRLLDEALGGGS